MHFRTTFWWYINWRGDALFPYFPPKENIFKCSSWCQSDIVRYHFPLNNLTYLNWTNFISQSVQSGWKIPHFPPFLDALASLKPVVSLTDWLTRRFQIVKIITKSTRHFSVEAKVHLGWDPWPGIPTPRSFKCLPELLSVCTNFTFRQNALVFLWISLSIFPESWVCFQIFLIFLEF